MPSRLEQYTFTSLINYLSLSWFFKSKRFSLYIVGVRVLLAGECRRKDFGGKCFFNEARGGIYQLSCRLAAPFFPADQPGCWCSIRPPGRKFWRRWWRRQSVLLNCLNWSVGSPPRCPVSRPKLDVIERHSAGVFFHAAAGRDVGSRF